MHLAQVTAFQWRSWFVYGWRVDTFLSQSQSLPQDWKRQRQDIVVLNFKSQVLPVLGGVGRKKQLLHYMGFFTRMDT